ncbi:hypothetical protein GGR56DRAFT_112592 [Xylariaceae sp. FL0804]|nr:hypothetical protein GGR56DRAFT_112592 [Xylariaceae sp. FL0804]
MSPSPVQQMLDLLNGVPLPRDRPFTVATAVAGVPLVAYLVSSYRGWLALGRGGLPANPLGYAINLVLQVVARRDVRAPAPYTLEELEPTYGAVARQSFFTPSPPPERDGGRPTVPSYVAPQRQMSERATPEMVARMGTFLQDVVAANSALLVMRPSRLEGPRHRAMWLADGVERPKLLMGTRGEFVHVHGEGSSHLVLSLADATRAIELCWAERHSLSGGLGGQLPWSYVLIYAPRTEEELGLWKTFVAASVRFVTTAAGGPGVTIPYS